MPGQLFPLRDGRTLEWADNGIDSKNSLIFHNGTTVALNVWGAWFEALAAEGVRAIGINRPGVGKSSSHHGRQIKDDVEDVRELLHYLEIENFVSVGWSGGGGRALGTALIDGCRSVHTIAGISPIDLGDEASITWLTHDRRVTISKYLQDFQAVLNDRRTQFEEDLTLTQESLLEFVTSLPHYLEYESDYQKFVQDLFAGLVPTLVNGPATDSEDYFANISSWGFSLNQIKVPVTIWHGESDEDVLLGRGAYLHSQIPQSEFITFPEQGHVSIMIEKRDEILNGAIKSLKALSI